MGFRPAALAACMTTCGEEERRDEHLHAWGSGSRALMASHPVAITPLVRGTQSGTQRTIIKYSDGTLMAL